MPDANRPRQRALVMGLLAAAGAAALAYGLLAGTGPAGMLKPDDPAVVARGQAVYAQQCARCHGADLAGQPNWREPGADGLLPAPPHDANGHTWHHPSEVLFGITKHGVQKYAGPDYKSAMPRYDGVLSDEDIVAALSFIKSTWPAQVRQLHDELETRQRR